jgi:hypothetical protein
MLCLSQKRTFTIAIYIKELEWDSSTALDLYLLMEKLGNKMSQRKEDTLFGEETEDMLKHDEKSLFLLRKTFLTLMMNLSNTWKSGLISLTTACIKSRVYHWERNQLILTSKKLLQFWT